MQRWKSEAPVKEQHKLSVLFCSGVIDHESDVSGNTPIFVDTESLRIAHLPSEFILQRIYFSASTSPDLTAKNYAYRLLLWLNYCADSSKDYLAPSDEALRAYIKHLRKATICRRTKRKISRSEQTIARLMATVYQFYEWCRDNNFARLSDIDLSREAFTGRSRGFLQHVRPSQFKEKEVRKFVRKRRSRQRLPNYYSRAEQEEILKELKGRDRLIVLWALFTGIREFEVCALQIDQLSEALKSKKRTIPVELRVTKYSVGGHIFVPRWLINETYQYVRFFDRKRAAANLRKRGKPVSEALFLSRSGNELKPNSVYKLFKAALKRAKQKGTFHDLRHTFAIFTLDRLMSNSTDRSQPNNALLILQYLMRHANWETTQIYLTAREFYLTDIETGLWEGHDLDREVYETFYASQPANA